MSLEADINKSRKIKDTSLKTYMCALNKLKYKIDGDDSKELKDASFLHDYDKVDKLIKEEEKITSKKNKLTAIIVALSSETPKKQELIDKFSDDLKVLNDKYMNFLKLQQKTDTQKKNWMTFKQLTDLTNKLYDKLQEKGITLNSTDLDLSNSEFTLLQQYVIMRVYLTFPLRNDFSCKIISKKDYDKLDEKEQKDDNYLVIKSKAKKHFVINQFKNMAIIGQRILEIPPNLNRIINLWLKYNKSPYFLVQYKDRSKRMTENGITKFFNKMFKKYAKKKISTSMIRHIVISNYLENEKTIEQKEQDEKNIKDKFFHSAKINDLYRKIDKNIEVKEPT